MFFIHLLITIASFYICWKLLQFVNAIEKKFFKKEISTNEEINLENVLDGVNPIVDEDLHLTKK